eukprot:TRINITY_DN19349_c0_g1_i1.p1 TRINITY_DN19349_c0_g1~~TRINITY_DN19349_c0_g1_i1.p1  ORF type:complete len:202 (+),score=29.63 TRINITY_DN19349_c0_g1_i1:60-665(+)
MSPIELLGHAESFLGRSDGRERASRLVGSVCHLAATLIPENEMRARLFAVRGNLANARRTNNWLKGLQPLQAALLRLRKARDEGLDQLLFLLSRAALFFYFALDHLRWLQQLRLVPGEPTRTAVISARVLVVSYLATSTLQAEKLAQVRGSPLPLIRTLLMLVQMLHAGFLVRSPEPVVATCGAVVAAYDCKTLWRACTAI